MWEKAEPISPARWENNLQKKVWLFSNVLIFPLQKQGLNKHDLLTAADEFALSKQFKLGANIQNQAKAMTLELGRNVTVEDLSNVLEIPTKTVVTLIEKGKMAKNKLVRANMRLVFHIANYYKTRGVAYPDLIQEGTVGLIKAVEKYDADRGFRFSTYASWWIKQVCP